MKIEVTFEIENEFLDALAVELDLDKKRATRYDFEESVKELVHIWMQDVYQDVDTEKPDY